MKSLKINLVAVVVLALAFQLTNFAWYSMVGQRWVELAGLQNVTNMESATSPFAYVCSLVNGLLLCYMMAWIFTKIQVESAVQGVLIAISLYGSFVFFEAATKDLFHLRSFMLTLINEGVNFINYALAGSVLGAWRKYEA